MFLGIVILIIGLALLAVTLTKVLGGDMGVKAQQWYGLALLGVILSLVGLIFSLQGMKKTAKVEITQSAPSTEKPLPKTDPEIEPATPPPPVVIDENETLIDPIELENLPPKAKRKLKNLKKQLQEDPDGEFYDSEDFQYFEKQVAYIRSGFDQAISETITGSPPAHKTHIPKGKLWVNMDGNLSLWVSNLKMRAARKKGPGTAAIKRRVYRIGDLMTSIGRVYTNAMVKDEEIDYQYISDLESEIERRIREIEELKKKHGI